MISEQENRRSFRVSELIYVKYEILTEEEFRNGIDHRNLRKGNADGSQSKLIDIEARLSEAMFLLNGEQGAIGRCMTLLNDKLNIVIEQTPSLRESKANLSKETPQTCDVSADGLVFSTERPLSVDDKLYLQFLLSTDNRYVETFCRVVRLTEPPDNVDHNLRYGVAVEFMDMQPSQREIIIQHMFSRESETLRMRRLEMESAEIET